MSVMPRFPFVALIASMLVACSEAPPPAPAAQPMPAAAPEIETLDTPGELSELEMTAEAPDLEDFEEALPAVPAAQAKSVKMHVSSETGYVNAAGLYVIDLMERDLAYVSVKIETPEGRPVVGAKPSFAAKGATQVTSVSDVDISDESGMVDFGLIGATMGEDRVTVTFAGATTEILLNVISLKAAGYASLKEVEGALRWEELMKARVKFKEDGVEAVFPDAIAVHNKKVVKLVGFMMPLDPDRTQKRFLLTANPPSCFFHIPGGPAGAVEVLSEKGIEATWDPIILEGTFETLPHSETGVIYRFNKVRVVEG